MPQQTQQRLRDHLKPGAVYRRRDLAPLSTNVDRHLKKLVDEGSLRKLQRGLYLCPEKSSFGETPAEENKLLKKFLGSDNFLAYSPNTFNSLGLGTTQLYNVRTVLNQKRHGPFLLNGQRYFFHRRMNIPKRLTKEILVVELLNNMKKLAEDPDHLLSSLSLQLLSLDHVDHANLMRAAEKYGTYSTEKKLREFASAVSA